MSGKSRHVRLKIQALPLNGQNETWNRDDFERFVRDGCRELFGNVSGLIDFEVVDQFDDSWTIKTNKLDSNRLWAALTLSATPTTLFTVIETVDE